MKGSRVYMRREDQRKRLSSCVKLRRSVRIGQRPYNSGTLGRKAKLTSILKWPMTLQEEEALGYDR